MRPNDPRPHPQRAWPSWWPRALALIAAAALASGALAGDAAPHATVDAARVSDDGSAILLQAHASGDGAAAGAEPGDAGAAAAPVERYGIDAWRAWAREHLDGAIRGPLAIGPIEVHADDFGRFGAAVASPDGERVLFSVTTYAMATTLSLVGVLEVDDEAIRMLPEPRMGDLEEPAWSPGGDHVAYTLGTARGQGQALHVDGLDGSDASFAVDWREMHARWLDAGLVVVESVAPDAYQPRFRDVAWSADGERLRFTADAPGAGTGEEPVGGRYDDAPPTVARRWSVAADGTDLRPEGPPAAGDGSP